MINSSVDPIEKTKRNFMNDADFLQNIVEEIPAGLILIDSGNNVVFVNSFFLRRTGYGIDELCGQGFFDRLFPDTQTREFVSKKICDCFNEPFEDVKAEIREKSGSIMAISISGKKIKKAYEEFIACIIHDITRDNIFSSVIEMGYDKLQQETIDLDTALKEITAQRKQLKEYKDKMTQELEIATEVQKTIIPMEFPVHEKIDIWGKSVACDNLGGDYFDFFYLDENIVGILIADVSGHGVPASLITTMLKAYFAYHTKDYRDPDKVFFHINNTLARILKDTDLYLTGLYCLLDFNTMEITVCTAGHDAPICFHPDCGQPVKIGADQKGMLLGIFPDNQYTSTRNKLVPGSRLLLYTDGITEARSITGEFFGYNRLINFIGSYFTNHRENGAQECINGLFSEIDAFYGGIESNDDRTAILIRVLDADNRK